MLVITVKVVAATEPGAKSIALHIAWKCLDTDFPLEPTEVEGDGPAVDTLIDNVGVTDCFAWCGIDCECYCFSSGTKRRNAFVEMTILQILSNLNLLISTVVPSRI